MSRHSCHIIYVRFSRIMQLPSNQSKGEAICPILEVNPKVYLALGFMVYQLLISHISRSFSAFVSDRVLRELLIVLG
jgi:hypothetical protein